VRTIIAAKNLAFAFAILAVLSAFASIYVYAIIQNNQNKASASYNYSLYVRATKYPPDERPGIYFVLKEAQDPYVEEAISKSGMFFANGLWTIGEWVWINRTDSVYWKYCNEEADYPVEFKGEYYAIDFGFGENGKVTGLIDFGLPKSYFNKTYSLYLGAASTSVFTFLSVYSYRRSKPKKLKNHAV